MLIAEKSGFGGADESWPPPQQCPSAPPRPPPPPSPPPGIPSGARPAVSSWRGAVVPTAAAGDRRVSIWTGNGAITWTGMVTPPTGTEPSVGDHLKGRWAFPDELAPSPPRVGVYPAGRPSPTHSAPQATPATLLSTRGTDRTPFTPLFTPPTEPSPPPRPSRPPPSPAGPTEMPISRMSLASCSLSDPSPLSPMASLA
eukprot:scaffold31985_cov84-Isochrysis_galbana.AAC.1